MTANDFITAMQQLGFRVERSRGSYYVVRDDKTFARIDRSRIRIVDTAYLEISKLDEKTGTDFMAVLFEFVCTPVQERDDSDYYVYTVYTDGETVGHRLHVTSYGNSGEKLMLDVGIGSALYASYDRAAEIAEQLSKNTGMKFEVEKAEL